MQLNNRIVSLIFAGAFSLIVTVPGLFGQYYTLRNLGAPPGADSVAVAINDSGLIVGDILPRNFDPEAFSYSGGIMTKLGNLGGAANYSLAYAVNNAGLIVGDSITKSAADHAFSYSAGVMIDLGTLPPASNSNFATDSVANAVNNSGLIVGESVSEVLLPSGVSFALKGYSDIGGVMTDLGTFGGFPLLPESVNDSGLIVGTVATGKNSSDEFTDNGGVITDLGSFGGTEVGTSDVNDSGLIVGYTYNSVLNEDDAFTYFNGVVTDLGENNIARAVNNSGLVIGDGIGGPFSYFGGVMTNLNTVTGDSSPDYNPGIVSLDTALGVNDEGQIVGQALNSYGVEVAYLLTPTDVPPNRTLSEGPDFVPDFSNSALLLVIGLAGIAIASRFRQKGSSTMLDKRESKSGLSPKEQVG